MQLPVASETQPTISTSLLVFVGNIFTPLIDSNVRLVRSMHRRQKRLATKLQQLNGRLATLYVALVQ